MLYLSKKRRGSDFAYYSVFRFLKYEEKHESYVVNIGKIMFSEFLR